MFAHCICILYNALTDASCRVLNNAAYTFHAKEAVKLSSYPSQHENSGNFVCFSKRKKLSPLAEYIGKDFMLSRVNIIIVIMHVEKFTGILHEKITEQNIFSALD